MRGGDKTLGFAVFACGHVRRDTFQQEFSDEVGCSIGTGAGEAVKQDERCSSVGGGIVEIGYGCRGEVAQHARIVRLPVPVIAARDYGRGDGIVQARADGSLSTVEIARVLMKDRGVNCASQENPRGVIGESGAVALAISLDSAAVGREDILVLFGTGKSRHA